MSLRTSSTEEDQDETGCQSSNTADKLVDTLTRNIDHSKQVNKIIAVKYSYRVSVCILFYD